MRKIKLLLVLVLTLLILMLLSFISGVFYDRLNTDPTRNISSVTVVDRINDEAFLLTKTVFIDQRVEIVIDEGSDWSNFWWGQSITAQALVKINIGVDLSKINEKDITVDQNSKTISIDVPAAEVIDTMVEGDIELENERGLLKLLFANDTDKDYNLAYLELKQKGIDAVLLKEDVFSQASTDAMNLLQLILKDTGYTLTFY